jgi:hypothetical protein
MSDGERPIAPDDYQTLETELGDSSSNTLRSSIYVKRTAATRTENRPSFMDDPSDRSRVEQDRVALQDAVPCVLKADDLIPVFFNQHSDERPDDGVQSWAVAASSKYSNSSSHQADCVDVSPRGEKLKQGRWQYADCVSRGLGWREGPARQRWTLL